MICCLFWGGNFVMAAWALGGTSVPPFMLATARAALVLLLMGVFLFRPLPKQFWRMMFVCLCVGPLHLGFLYTGLQTASASATSILSQSMIPMATILSVLWLKESVGWKRGLAIVVAMVGVFVMIYEPGALRPDIGLVYIMGAYIAMAVGTVAMRRVPDVDWRVYVAWTAVIVFLFGGLASFLFESGQVQVWEVDKVPLLIAAAYAALCVSVFAHGQYFRLLQTYPVNRVVPLGIMTTVFATVLGVVLLDETLYPRYIFGALLILPCVWVIARRGTPAPLDVD